MPEGQNYTYRYPNQASYALLPVNAQHGNFHWQGRSLRHGYIFGYKQVTANASNSGGVANRAEFEARESVLAAMRQPDFTNYKMFQFNPPALTISAQMMQTESPDVQAQGGADTTSGVGLATTRLELMFDRTEEITRSNNGHGSTAWRDLGVQQDLFDLLKVMSGGDQSKLGLYTDVSDEGGTVRKESTNSITGNLFDAALAGNSALNFCSFAVVFNPNLAIHVRRLTGFTFTYLRFTSDLVPTTVQVELDLEIANMGTKSYITSNGIAGPNQQPAAQAAPPGTTASSTSRTGPPPGGLQADRQF